MTRVYGTPRTGSGLAVARGWGTLMDTGFQLGGKTTFQNETEVAMP